MTQAFLRASAAFLFMSVRDMQNRPRDGRIRGVYGYFMPEKPALGARAARKPCVAARRAQRRDRSENAARAGQELHTKILVRLRAASRCACFSFTQLQGPLSCDRGSSTQFRVVSSCTSAWRTQLEPSRTALLLLSAALRHLEALLRLRLAVRPSRALEMPLEMRWRRSSSTTPPRTRR